MEVRLGFGGKILGVRGGVSNKGFGVGVGPFSAGSSWKSGKSRQSSGRSTGRKSAGQPSQKGSSGLLWAAAALAAFAVDHAERRINDAERQGDVEAAHLKDDTQSTRGPLRGLMIFGVCLVVCIAAVMGLVAIFSGSSTDCPNEASRGSVLVPNVEGKKADKARDELEDAGFRVDMQAYPNYRSIWNESNWTVKSAAPSACMEASRGSSVVLTVTK